METNWLKLWGDKRTQNGQPPSRNYTCVEDIIEFYTAPSFFGPQPPFNVHEGHICWWGPYLSTFLRVATLIAYHQLVSAVLPALALCSSPCELTAFLHSCPLIDPLHICSHINLLSIKILTWSARSDDTIKLKAFWRFLNYFVTYIRRVFVGNSINHLELGLHSCVSLFVNLLPIRTSIPRRIIFNLSLEKKYRARVREREAGGKPEHVFVRYRLSISYIVNIISRELIVVQNELIH